MGGFLGICLYFVDRVSKWLAFAYLQGKEPMVIIPRFFQLHFVANRGVAFGLFASLGYLQPYFAIVLAGVLLYLLYKYEFTKGQKVAMALIIAGALGNATDRFIYGYVVDMLEVTFVSFPVFNLADIAITLGVVGMIIAILSSSVSFEKKERGGSDENL